MAASVRLPLSRVREISQPQSHLLSARARQVAPAVPAGVEDDDWHGMLQQRVRVLLDQRSPSSGAAVDALELAVLDVASAATAPPQAPRPDAAEVLALGIEQLVRQVRHEHLLQSEVARL